MKQTYKIATTWDGVPITHDPVIITLNQAVDEIVEMDILAPFFNDPPAPKGSPGKPFPVLWEYEVMEAFFLTENKRYLEVEFCPHGQHLLLLLEGERNILKQQLAVDYTAEIIDKKWHGVAKIPASYFPPDIKLFNAYAMHGSNDKRTYESLYPTPKGKYEEPDFHNLKYFKPIKFEEILPTNTNSSLSDIWKEAIDNNIS